MSLDIGSVSNRRTLVMLAVLSPTTRIEVRCQGWSGGAMVLGKLPVPGRPTHLD